jgi:transposase-like protein
MRYPASEKIEIIRTVEQSHLSVRRTLEKIGIPRATFYRWYDLYQSADPRRWRTAPPAKPRSEPHPGCVRQQIVHLALDSGAVATGVGGALHRH